MKNIVLLNDKFEPSVSHSVNTILKKLLYVTLLQNFEGNKGFSCHV